MNRTTVTAALAAAALPLAALPLTLVGLSPAGASAGPDARAGSYAVKAKINKSTAVADEDVVKVKGKVKPKAKGQKVILQQRLEGKKTWSKTGKAKVKANGGFVLKDAPSTAGTRYYRVLMPTQGKVKKGLSKELKLVVYGWENLGWRARGPVENIVVTEALIGTDKYPTSLVSDVAGTPSSVEYTLGRKCLQLKSGYALTDSSASGAIGSVTVSTDGSARVTHPLSVGTIVENSVLNITGVFRLKLDMTSSASPAGVTAVATPQVLCTK